MAAGFGTRLQPITNNIPKPLVPVNGFAMVEYVLGLAARFGIREALINIHHHPEMMRHFVTSWNISKRLPRLFIQDETKKLLDSGGSIAQGASWLFGGGDTALICNADVISRPDLGAMLEKHKSLSLQSEVECTLALVAHPETGRKYNGIRVEKGLIRGFEQTGIADPSLYHFPGFYFIDKKITARIAHAGEVFKIIDVLWKPLMAEHKLGGWIYTGEYYDLGTKEDLLAAETALASKPELRGLLDPIY